MPVAQPVGIEQQRGFRISSIDLQRNVSTATNPFEYEVVDSFFEQFSSNAKITYNSVTGSLSFNRNGSVLGGDAEGNIIADLNPSNTPGGSPNISAADILIIA